MGTDDGMENKRRDYYIAQKLLEMQYHEHIHYNISAISTETFPIVVCLLCGLLIFEFIGLRSLQVVTKQKLFWIYPDNNSADIQEHDSSNVKPLNTFLMNEACQENQNEVFSEFETIQLLFVVKSHILNIGKREAIRRTWGNVKELHVKTVFVVGYLQNMDTFADFETKRYKDIIRMKMEDKYENIVYKTIYSVLCLSGLNIKTEFVHIVDDDRLVNALNVYDIAMKSIAQSEIAMIGFMVYLSRPDRKETSKNYISWEDYPFLYFPSYIIGGTILTNMKTINQLAKAVEYVKIVQIEDVFIGMVATAFKIDMRHHSGFSPFKQPVHLLKNTLSSPGYETAYLLLRDWELMRRW
ncbi:B3GNT7 [Mytilus coruscus]|uniref:Hexosyltransferase n=1 Tax=Mytilus coruscus TaxID=42192 RepID=A0A6J8ABX7_MYTCO|nr:B3GNT7 [Mytilus coruscus]